MVLSKLRFHTSDFRGKSTPQGPKSMIAVAMDVGENTYLDEQGRYPALSIPRPLPDVTSQEDDVPSGCAEKPWLTAGDVVSGKIAAICRDFIWLALQANMWGKLSPDPSFLAMMELNDSILKMAVLEVKQTYVALDPDGLERTNHPTPGGSKNERDDDSEYELYMPRLNKGDILTGTVMQWDKDTDEVWVTIDQSRRFGIMVEPRE